jgi:hypothetical protein
MTPTLRRHSTVAAALAGVLLFAGCTATAGGEAATDAAPAPSSSETGAPPPAPSPTALATPPVAQGEIARAEFTDGGPGGIPTASSVVSDAFPGAVLIEGECLGTSARFRLSTAAPADDKRTLLEGTITCGAPYVSSFSQPEYTGVIQLEFVDANDITAGWVRVMPTNS